MTPYSILSDNEMLFKYVPVGALASGALLSVPVWLYSLPTVPVPGWIGMNTTLGFHKPSNCQYCIDLLSSGSAIDVV